jgi:hypothetical protein
MAENDSPGREEKFDPSKDTDSSARVSAHGHEEGGGQDEKDRDRKKDEPGASGKGINPVQHSE